MENSVNYLQVAGAPFPAGEKRHSLKSNTKQRQAIRVTFRESNLKLVDLGFATKEQLEMYGYL